DTLGRTGHLPDFARRLDDLEQQSSRCRDGACRARCGHAIFWCEYFCDFPAHFTRRGWASGGRRTGRAVQRSRLGMKTATIERPNIAASRNCVVFDIAELVYALLAFHLLLTSAVGLYIGYQYP